MALIISDANIFIDLECADLTARMFRLDFEFAVPDLLYINELSKHHGDLPGLGLQLRPLRPELIREASNRAPVNPELSTYDLLALVLAHDEDCPLLTGDGFLREAAEAEGITVYGTIWLMEQLIRARLISIGEMAAAYQAMIQANRRLPSDVIQRQLTRLKKELGR